jgi:hypothetical protein
MGVGRRPVFWLAGRARVPLAFSKGKTMLKKFTHAALAASVMAGSAFAAPAKKAAPKPAPKPIDVKICPTANEKVVGNGSGSEVVGKYRVYFCCAGCEKPFNKLSQMERLAKVESLYKRQVAEQKKAKKK